MTKEEYKKENYQRIITHFKRNPESHRAMFPYIEATPTVINLDATILPWNGPVIKSFEFFRNEFPELVFEEDFKEMLDE